MPKELHEIKGFNAGTISSSSQTDIPDDAATFSLDVEPVSESGILKGTTENTQFLASVNATSMANIVDNGTYNTIYHDVEDNKIKIIEDIHGDSPTISDLSSSAETGSDPVMQVNNKEVHIGMNNGDPLWAGKILHGQFGAEATDIGTNGYTVQSSKIEMASGLGVSKGAVYGVIGDTDSIYSLNAQNGVDKIAADSTVTENTALFAADFPNWTFEAMTENLDASWDVWLIGKNDSDTIVLIQYEFAGGTYTTHTVNTPPTGFDVGYVAQIKEDAKDNCVVIFQTPQNPEGTGSNGHSLIYSDNGSYYDDPIIYFYKTPVDLTGVAEGNISLTAIDWIWENRLKPLESSNDSGDQDAVGEFIPSNNHWLYKNEITGDEIPDNDMGQTRKVWNLFDGKIKIIEGTMEGDDGNKADLSRVFRLDSDNKWVHNTTAHTCGPILAVCADNGFFMEFDPDGSVTLKYIVEATGEVKSDLTYPSVEVSASTGTFSAFMTKTRIYCTEEDNLEVERLVERRYNASGIEQGWEPTNGNWQEVNGYGSTKTYQKHFIMFATDAGSAYNETTLQTVILMQNEDNNDATGEDFYIRMYYKSGDTWSSYNITSGGNDIYDDASGMLNASEELNNGAQVGTGSGDFTSRTGHVQRLQFGDITKEGDSEYVRFAITDTIPYGYPWDYYTAASVKIYQAHFIGLASPTDAQLGVLASYQTNDPGGTVHRSNYTSIYTKATSEGTASKLYVSECNDDPTRSNSFYYITDNANYTDSHSGSSNSAPQSYTKGGLIEIDNNEDARLSNIHGVLPSKRRGISGWYIDDVDVQDETWLVLRFDENSSNCNVNTHLVKDSRLHIYFPKYPLFTPKSVTHHGIGIACKFFDQKLNDSTISGRRNIWYRDKLSGTDILGWFKHKKDSPTWDSFIFLQNTNDQILTERIGQDDSATGTSKIVYLRVGAGVSSGFWGLWPDVIELPDHFLDTYTWKDTNSLHWYELDSSDRKVYRNINFVSNDDDGDNNGEPQDNWENISEISVPEFGNLDLTSYNIDTGDTDFAIPLVQSTTILYHVNTSSKGGVSKLTTDWSGITHTWSTLGESIIDIGISQTGAGTSTYFKESTEYFYKVSFVFDGYQESELSGFSSEHFGTSTTNFLSQPNLSIQLTLKNVETALNKRITHINLYRSDGAVGDYASGVEEGYYRLIKSMKTDSTWAVHSTTHRRKTVTDTGVSLSNYEARTGLPETIYDLTPRYGLSAQLNNQLYIAKCIHSGIDDASNYLFKSMPFNFSQFDWSKDLLRLPTTPTAIAAFNGRIYAFDNNNTYRIEPNSFYIEDIYEGVGCIDKNCVLVTEYGMFIANKNNIFLHNGQMPTPIGNQILTSDGNNLVAGSPRNFSWLESDDTAIDKTYNPKLAFDSTRNALVVLFKSKHSIGTNLYFAWVYTLTSNRWDLWTFGTKEPLSILSGKDGEMFISTQGNLINYAGDYSSKKPFTWESKQLTMNADSQDKKFINFKTSGSIQGSLANNIYVELDNSPSSESGTISEFKINDKKGKKIKWFLKDQVGEIDSLATIFRRLRIK